MQRNTGAENSYESAQKAVLRQLDTLNEKVGYLDRSGLVKEGKEKHKYDTEITAIRASLDSLRILINIENMTLRQWNECKNEQFTVLDNLGSIGSKADDRKRKNKVAELKGAFNVNLAVFSDQCFIRSEKNTQNRSLQRQEQDQKLIETQAGQIASLKADLTLTQSQRDKLRGELEEKDTEVSALTEQLSNSSSENNAELGNTITRLNDEARQKDARIQRLGAENERLGAQVNTLKSALRRVLKDIQDEIKTKTINTTTTTTTATEKWQFRDGRGGKIDIKPTPTTIYSVDYEIPKFAAKIYNRLSEFDFTSEEEIGDLEKTAKGIQKNAHTRGNRCQFFRAIIGRSDNTAKLYRKFDRQIEDVFKSASPD